MVTAEGPGAQVTGSPADTAAATSRYPGSETVGIPASVTRTTLSPFATAATRSSVRAASLCSW